MQPTLVLSLGLTSEACTLVPSPQLHQHMSILGRGMQGGSANLLFTLLCFALLKRCALLLASEAPLRLGWSPCQWGTAQSVGNLPPRLLPGCRLHLFLFSFCPTQLCGGFLALWEWGLLLAFGRCSVSVIPLVDVFLVFLWGRWASCPTPPPFWAPPPTSNWLT